MHRMQFFPNLDGLKETVEMVLWMEKFTLVTGGLTKLMLDCWIFFFHHFLSSEN